VNAHEMSAALLNAIEEMEPREPDEWDAFCFFWYELAYMLLGAHPRQLINSMLRGRKMIRELNEV
jgi:hypothetical protein